MTLLEQTYDLLDASDLTYPEIASGASVDVNWLSKFKQRAIGEPGVGKVQRLHDFLVSRLPAASSVPHKSDRGEQVA